MSGPMFTQAPGLIGSKDPGRKPAVDLYNQVIIDLYTKNPNFDPQEAHGIAYGEVVRQFGQGGGVANTAFVPPDKASQIVNRISPPAMQPPVPRPSVAPSAGGMDTFDPQTGGGQRPPVPAPPPTPPPPPIPQAPPQFGPSLYPSGAGYVRPPAVIQGQDEADPETAAKLSELEAMRAHVAAQAGGYIDQETGEFRRAGYRPPAGLMAGEGYGKIASRDPAFQPGQRATAPRAPDGPPLGKQWGGPPAGELVSISNPYDPKVNLTPAANAALRSRALRSDEQFQRTVDANRVAGQIGGSGKALMIAPPSGTNNVEKAANTDAIVRQMRQQRQAGKDQRQLAVRAMKTGTTPERIAAQEKMLTGQPLSDADMMALYGSEGVAANTEATSARLAADPAMLEYQALREQGKALAAGLANADPTQVKGILDQIKVNTDAAADAARRVGGKIVPEVKPAGNGGVQDAAATNTKLATLAADPIFTPAGLGVKAKPAAVGAKLVAKFDPRTMTIGLSPADLQKLGEFTKTWYEAPENIGTEPKVWDNPKATDAQLMEYAILRAARGEIKYEEIPMMFNHAKAARDAALGESQRASEENTSRGVRAGAIPPGVR